MYYVYVLKSTTLNAVYIGHTNDLKKRLHQHISGYSRATRLCDDWNLIHSEQYSTRALAMKREKYLKSGDGRKVLTRKNIA